MAYIFCEWTNLFTFFNILCTYSSLEYLCHKWSPICSTCHKHFLVLSPFMTYHWVCNKSITTGATNRTGTVCSSGTPVFFSGATICEENHDMNHKLWGIGSKFTDPVPCFLWQSKRSTIVSSFYLYDLICLGCHK
jgi:hypothetical protein